MDITRHRHRPGPAILTHISVLCSSETQIDDSSADDQEGEEEYTCPLTPISHRRISSTSPRKPRYRRSRGIDAEESGTLSSTSPKDPSIEAQVDPTTMSASVTDSTTNPIHLYRNVIRQYHLTQMQETGVDVNACSDRNHKAATTFSPSRSVLPKSQRSARPPQSAAPTSDLSNRSSISETRWDAAMESAMTPPMVSRTGSQKGALSAATPSLRSTPRYPLSRGEWNHSYTVTPEEMVRESIFAGRAAVEEVMRRLSVEQTQQSDSESEGELDEGISMGTKTQSGIKSIISSEPLHPELSFTQTKPNRARGQSQGHDQVATAATDAVNRLDVGMRLKSEVDLRLLEEMYDEEQGTPSNTPAPGKGMLRANTVAATRGGKRLGRSLTTPLKSGVMAAECF